MSVTISNESIRATLGKRAAGGSGWHEGLFATEPDAPVRDWALDLCHQLHTASPKWPIVVRELARRPDRIADAPLASRLVDAMAEALVDDLDTVFDSYWSDALEALDLVSLKAQDAIVESERLIHLVQPHERVALVDWRERQVRTTCGLQLSNGQRAGFDEWTDAPLLEHCPTCASAASANPGAYPSAIPVARTFFYLPDEYGLSFQRDLRAAARRDVLDAFCTGNFDTELAGEATTQRAWERIATLTARLARERDEEWLARVIGRPSYDSALSMWRSRPKPRHELLPLFTSTRAWMFWERWQERVHADDDIDIMERLNRPRTEHLRAVAQCLTLAYRPSDAPAAELVLP